MKLDFISIAYIKIPNHFDIWSVLCGSLSLETWELPLQCNPMRALHIESTDLPIICITYNDVDYTGSTACNLIVCSTYDGSHARIRLAIRSWADTSIKLKSTCIIKIPLQFCRIVTGHIWFYIYYGFVINAKSNVYFDLSTYSLLTNKCVQQFFNAYKYQTSRYVQVTDGPCCYCIVCKQASMSSCFLRR